MNELIHTVRKFIETKRLLTPSKPIITGFSGGADSVALLFILNRLNYKCIAAHCNFHLRGEESDRDEAFCKQFAENHGITFESVAFDTKEYASANHISVEMAARELRYNWFETVRQKFDAQAIAVAHHRDDSAETLLLNLIRGAGIRGLCGIRHRNGLIVRPLLCTDKDEILKFVKNQGLDYITDNSNNSDEYTRNFVRLRVIPLMEQVNPSVKATLARTTEHLADAESIYINVIEKAKRALLQKINNEEFTLDIDALLGYDTAETVLFEVLRDFGFTRQVTEEIMRSLHGESGKIFYAPETEMQVVKDRNRLIISKITINNSTEEYLIEDIENLPAAMPLKISFRKQLIDSDFEIDRSQQTATFDYDRIKFPLKLRKWRSGDRFVPFGMKNFRKLSDFFTDNKYSLFDKAKVWLLCSGEDILWIVGARADNRFRLTEKSKNALTVKIFL